MKFVDTHCHIQEADYGLPTDEVLRRARARSVDRIIVVGTSLDSLRRAAEFAAVHDGIFAAIGVHPHDAAGIQLDDTIAELAGLLQSDSKISSVPAKKSDAVTARTELARKVVGIGEIGLDYFYNHSPRAAQIEALNQQIELAEKHNLPISFHVRAAFDDFWPIFDNFGGRLRSVLHSFTDNIDNLEKALARGLSIGVNGIATFNKDSGLTQVYRALPLDNLLLETDAPFLTPVPYRGKINEPAYVADIAEFLAKHFDHSLKEIADSSTLNAVKLFNLE